MVIARKTRSIQMKKMAMVTVLFFMIFTVQAFSQRSVLFPRFVTGQGWTSDFFFINQGISSVSIVVNFYDKNGSSVSVDSNLGAGANYSFSLNGGGTQAIQLNTTSRVVEGYMIATYPDSQSAVRGTEVFRYEENGTVLGDVGVSQQEFGQHYSFPVEISSSRKTNTGLALTKPALFSPNEERIVVNLLEADGKIHATQLVTMKPGQHIGAYLNQEPYFPGLGDFTGSVSISSPFGIGVLALREDTKAFGAISVDRGPVLFPFAFPGNVIQEVEPNDDSAHAQVLSGSAVVEGSGALLGDVDIYRFSGKSGDIVSIICDTTQKNSRMDPVLFLFDASFNPASANDQNGLAPKLTNAGDAFIQCALPKDGIYYIVVLDYYGSSGGYTLHVNLPH
jgi:hypothetical protein